MFGLSAFAEASFSELPSAGLTVDEIIVFFSREIPDTPIIQM